MLDGGFEHSGAGLLAEWVDAEVRTQAVATGYANAFEAIRASVPWRPALSDDAGQPLHPKPVIGGPLLATVVGAEGATSSPAEIHTDRLGRIRIRHEFQSQAEGSTWVRVLQPSAGPGMGMHARASMRSRAQRPRECACTRSEGPSPIPRIGQHQPSGQDNLSGGHSALWHGASAHALIAQAEDAFKQREKKMSDTGGSNHRARYEAAVQTQGTQERHRRRRVGP